MKGAKCIFNRWPSSFLSLSLPLFVSSTPSLILPHCQKLLPRRNSQVSLVQLTGKGLPKNKTTSQRFFSLSPQFGNSLRFLLHFFFFFIDHYLNTIAGPSPSRKVPNHKNHFMPAAPEESETFCFLHFFSYLLSGNKSNKANSCVCVCMCVCVVYAILYACVCVVSC